MSIYTQQLLLACIVVFIVDLSGFTESWRDALLRILNRAFRKHGIPPLAELPPLKPFDCSLCMTWWVCLIYPICTGDFSLLTLANAAALAFLSNTIRALALFIYDLLMWVINKVTLQ